MSSENRSIKFQPLDRLGSALEDNSRPGCLRNRPKRFGDIIVFFNDGGTKLSRSEMLDRVKDGLLEFWVFAQFHADCRPLLATVEHDGATRNVQSHSEIMG